MDQKTVEGRRLSGQDTPRLRATQNDPFGLYQPESFGNFLTDTVSVRAPSRQSRDGATFLRRRRQSASRRCRT
jgi:hypothetical protein